MALPCHYVHRDRHLCCARECECRHERHAFHLKFKLTSVCKEPVGLIAHFTFGKTTDADPDAKQLFKMLGSAPTHVGLEITNEGKRTIEPGKPYETNALATGQDFNFFVRLRETRYSVGGGAFTRPVDVTVEFL